MQLTPVLQQNKPASAARRAEAVIDNKRFSALENLLNQSEMYSRFLLEQMNDIETKVDNEAATSSAAAAAALKGQELGSGITGSRTAQKGGKRTRGGASKQATQAAETKADKPALTATQVGTLACCHAP